MGYSQVNGYVGFSARALCFFRYNPGMTTWAVIFTPEAEQEFSALPADMQAQGLRVIDLLQTNGPQQVREPYVKPVEEKLWEIRLRG